MPLNPSPTVNRQDQIDIVAQFQGDIGNIDLCFLIDATGSMQPHIDGVKAQIKKIVKDLTAKAVTNQRVQNLRLALVAYRDFGTIGSAQHRNRRFSPGPNNSFNSDSDSESNQFEIFPFSQSENDFEDFCAKVLPISNMDPPEDVFGGLEKALELNWSKDSDTKMIFHICDAPCHGRDFHDLSSDNYPKGDPKGRTHTELFKKLNELEIQYYFGKINSSTNTMIEKFSEVYDGQIFQFEVDRVTEIQESVVGAVRRAAYVTRCRRGE